MLHETTFFAELRHLPPLDNAVRVADVPMASMLMFLMIRKESIPADRLEGGRYTKIADVVT